MILRKCDVCDKLLTKQDDYFTLDEVTFNKGNKDTSTMRLTISDETASKSFDMIESWCDYSDKHFCVECWKKESIASFYK